MGANQNPNWQVPLIERKKTWRERYASLSDQEKAAIIRSMVAVLVAFLSLVGLCVVQFLKASKVPELQHTVLSLKSDVGTLTTQKTALETQLADFRQIPATVPLLFSNVVRLIELQPTNSQQLSGVLVGLQTITNQLAEVIARPTFELSVNRQTVPVGSAFSVNQSRRLVLELRNLSEFTAEQLSIAMLLPFAIDPTNVIASPGWRLGVPSTVSKKGMSTRIPTNNQWRWKATEINSGLETYCVDAFEVSTNCPSGSFDLEIRVFANRSKVEVYFGRWTF
jgi:hypothetical protein